MSMADAEPATEVDVGLAPEADERAARRVALTELAAMIGVEVFY